MNTKTIYLVYEEECCSIDGVTAVFDNKEDVEKFLSRFKDRADGYEVREMVLNPQYRGDKTRNPYNISLHLTGAVNSCPAFDPYESEMAIDNQHTTSGSSKDCPTYLDCYLLAESQEEAVIEGMSRLQQLVDEGVFKVKGKLRRDNF